MEVKGPDAAQWPSEDAATNGPSTTVPPTPGAHPGATVTVGPVTQTAEQIAAEEGRTRPVGVALLAEQVKADRMEQVRALLAEQLGELDAERARLQAALDALDGR